MYCKRTIVVNDSFFNSNNLHKYIDRPVYCKSLFSFMINIINQCILNKEGKVTNQIRSQLFVAQVASRRGKFCYSVDLSVYSLVLL